MDATTLRRMGVAYKRWLLTPEAAELKVHKPLNYQTLVDYPNNFPKVRAAFHVVWITQKMLS